MSIENPFSNNSKKTKEDEVVEIKGDNFVIKRKHAQPFSISPVSPLSSHGNDTSVQFRHGETNRAKINEIEESEKIKEIKYLLDFVLEKENSYSETIEIRPDGKFNEICEHGHPLFLQSINTPEELYKIAAGIEQKYPEYKFGFENDSEGKWMKYKISKLEK